MKVIMFLLLLTMFLDRAASQTDEYFCAIDSTYFLPGITPASMIGKVECGGKEITNQGVLKVLVVFFRFADDVQNTPDWPNYNVLPAWCQQFVDVQVPTGAGRYTVKNFSDYFDRASGGDGNGNLGQLKIIGDVYYVTTVNPRSSYTDNTQVHTEVWQTLDNPNGPYKVDFSKYDNWKWRVGGYYFTHQNIPDGVVDYLFMMWRGAPIYDLPNVEGRKITWGYFTSNDNGTSIDMYGGSTQYYYGQRGAFDPLSTPKAKAIYVPAHEFLHYIYGGGHLTDNGTNVGNVEFFACMTGNTSGSINAYERYRAGWLNPDIVEQNVASKTIMDTHVKNKAVMIPIRTSGQNKLEYFLIENRHSTNDYATANPFLRTNIFQHSLQKGLLVFHIENEILNDPMRSNLDIESADGLWQWTVAQGGATPSDRTDDVMAHSSVSATGYDDRDLIPITVGSIPYTDYRALRYQDNSCGSGNPCNSPCTPITCNHGWRWNRSSFLGDNDDFFRNGETNVLSRWSNPSSSRADLLVTDRAFEVLSYNATTKEYTLKIAVDYANSLALAPSKPQHLQVSVVVQGGDNNPKLTWIAGSEPDVNPSGNYLVHRRTKITQWGNWSLIATISGSSSQYIDLGITSAGSGPDSVQYKIQAKDTQAKISAFSDVVSIRYNSNANKPFPSVETPRSFSLGSYPNPFNPSTSIIFEVPNKSVVKFSIFDVLGRSISELTEEVYEPGVYSRIWDGTNTQGNHVSAGIYFLKMIAKDEGAAIQYSNTNKLVLLR